MQAPANTPGFSRRKFLGSSLAALFPLSTIARWEPNPDVVIVGAGAAGIAAARTLLNLQQSIVVLEATDRIGGRAYTDHSTFGVPFDTGAHWLHYGSMNPYHQFGLAQGYDVYPAPENYRIFKKDREASTTEIDELWDTYESVTESIGNAGAAGMDVAASQVTNQINNQWGNTAKFVVGPWSMGKDLEDFSTLDWWNSLDGADYYCAQGYGSLVAANASGLNVSLNTAVTKINWQGSTPIVETTKGTLYPKAVVMTVSTGVLASGEIRFIPELPVEKQESFDAISMGEYEHIAIQFSEDIFGMGSDGYLLFQIGEDGRGFGTLTNVSGSGLAYCDVGGQWARELLQKPERDRIAYALGELRKMIGSEVDRTFIKGAATSWGLNPWTRGSYASARPGSYPMRRKLRETIADQLFFAGEAWHQSQWATVGGADLSGVNTARAVVKSLARRG